MVTSEGRIPNADSKTLSPLDSAFLYFERPNQLLHVGCLARIDGPIAHRDLVELTEERLGTLERYHQRPVRPAFDLGAPRWEVDPATARRQKADAAQNDSRFKTLLSDLNNAAILSATGAHWEEDQYDWWSMNTDTRTTAIVLDALIKLDPQNQIAPNVVRWLMVARKDGIWETTQESAWALMALTDWMAYTKELQADYDYGLWLNEREQTSGGDGDGGGIAAGDGDLRQAGRREVPGAVEDADAVGADQPFRLAVVGDPRVSGDLGHAGETEVEDGGECHEKEGAKPDHEGSSSLGRLTTGFRRVGHLC